MAAHNRLVGGSSPLRPTTQSYANRDFPLPRELARFRAGSCERLGLCNRSIGFSEPFRGRCLWLKFPVSWRPLGARLGRFFIRLPTLLGQPAMFFDPFLGLPIDFTCLNTATVNDFTRWTGRSGGLCTTSTFFTPLRCARAVAGPCGL